MKSTAESNDTSTLRLILAELASGASGQWAKSPALSVSLRDKSGVRIHWRTIDRLLGKHREFAERRRNGRAWSYLLLASGRDFMSGHSPGITMVDPHQAVPAVLSLHSLLASLSGAISICDPYLDTSTFEHLDAIPKVNPVRFLTRNIKDSGTLRRVVAAFPSAGRTLEIRVATSSVLHDRYIADATSMILLGTSLNGFAKRQTFVFKAGAEIRLATLSFFDGVWLSATPWP